MLFHDFSVPPLVSLSLTLKFLLSFFYFVECHMKSAHYLKEQQTTDYYLSE